LAGHQHQPAPAINKPTRLVDGPARAVAATVGFGFGFGFAVTAVIIIAIAIVIAIADAQNSLEHKWQTATRAPTQTQTDVGAGAGAGAGAESTRQRLQPRCRCCCLLHAARCTPAILLFLCIVLYCTVPHPSIHASCCCHCRAGSRRPTAWHGIALSSCSLT
jgi:hypothetical protein